MRHRFVNLNGLGSLLLIATGTGAIIMAFALDPLGIGGQRGIGTKEVILASVGLAFVTRGIGLLCSCIGWPSHRERSDRLFSPRWISLLGGISVVCFAAYAVMSYGMAPLVPFGRVEPYRAKLSDQLIGAVGFLGQGFQRLVSGQTILAERQVLVLAYGVPVVVCTGVFLVLLILLARHHASLGATMPRLLFRWGAVFGVVTLLACPVLVLDFWYPIAWGRMVVAGINPYYHDLMSEFVQDLPLEQMQVRMMYGPLWALTYSIVMWFAGGRVLLAALILKLLLAGAWIGALRLVWALLHEAPLWHQCVGMAIFGWLPISVMQAVGEGHNDIFMVFFLLLWLYALQRDKPIRASLSLTASVLIKYVSVPLFLLDFLHLVRSSKQRPTKYLPQAVASALMIALIGGIFYRSPEFFAYLPVTSTWHFYGPREAMLALLLFLGVKASFLGEAARMIFLPIALFFGLRYVQRPEPERFREAVLATMCAMLFGISSHMWPWYSLWILALAALVPGSALARWGVGMAILTPFPIMVWVIFPDIDPLYIFDIPALAIYTYSLLWLLVAPRRWFPGAEDTTILQAVEPMQSAHLREVRQ